MITLNNLVATNKKRKRVGRGGSRGGTSGRGHKGQKARTSGTVGPLFEGGQMPLHRRLPKRGFSNARFAQETEIINLAQLELSFDEGAQISKQDLIDKGFIKGKRGVRVKLLGNGAVTKKLVIDVDACSASARQAIEKQGGDVRIIQES